MIKRALMTVIVLLAVSVTPVVGWGGGWNTVTYNSFSFSFDPTLATNVNIVHYPGDPVDLQAPGGPEVKHTQFVLYNGLPAPESQYDAVGGIRMYQTVDFAGYEYPSMQLVQLQNLLVERPDLASYMVVAEDLNNSSLPYMPVFPAGQVIRARAQYVDLPTISGISYVTVYRQDASPLISSDFWYTFQGLSTDGLVYVSAAFKLSPSMFPAELDPNFDYEAFMATFTDYMNGSIAQLNAATPDQFSPSLTTLDGMIQSFIVTG